MRHLFRLGNEMTFDGRGLPLPSRAVNLDKGCCEDDNDDDKYSGMPPVWEVNISSKVNS
jgi:hypothetical protein